VCANDGEASNEHQCAGEVDDGRDLRIVEVRLDEGKLGRDHRDDGRSEKARNLL